MLPHGVRETHRANIHRMSIIGAVIVCLAVAQANVTVFASEADTSTTETLSSQLPETVRTTFKLDVQTPFTLEPAAANAFTGQVYRGRSRRMNRSGSIAAIMIGAAAVIAGSAVLVYANRPECSTNQFAGGCGYGTKVIGGSVVAGGVVGMAVGALTWR